MQNCLYDMQQTSLENIINNDGELIQTVVGKSMFPMLKNRRDNVIIEKVNRPLVKFDVPLYRSHSGKYILHRILKVKGEIYIIRGDNTYKKEYVHKEQIVGVLKGFYRKNKYYDIKKSKHYRAYIYFTLFTYPVRWCYVMAKRIVRKIFC